MRMFFILLAFVCLPLALTAAQDSDSPLNETLPLSELKQVAQAGFLIDRDSQLILGKYKGSTGQYLLFSTPDGELQSIRADALSAAPVEKQLELGYTLWCRALITDAREAFTYSDYLTALKAQNEAQSKLNKISSSVPEKAALKEELAALSKRINDDMAQQDLTEYKGKMMKKSVVDSNLAAGQIYFRNEVWIYPHQKCSYCKTKGIMTCPDCVEGRARTKCTACNEGYLPCPKCAGSGAIVCAECNGTRGEEVRCARCSGTGSVRESTPGSGYYYGHYTYYPGYVMRRVTCDVCNGTGKVFEECRACHGSGKMSCPTRVVCTKCNGSTWVNGVCKTCKGTCQVVCGHCRGRGYTDK